MVSLRCLTSSLPYALNKINSVPVYVEYQLEFYVNCSCTNLKLNIRVWAKWNVCLSYPCKCVALNQCFYGSSRLLSTFPAYLYSLAVYIAVISTKTRIYQLWLVFLTKTINILNKFRFVVWANTDRCFLLVTNFFIATTKSVD